VALLAIPTNLKCSWTRRREKTEREPPHPRSDVRVNTYKSQSKRTVKHENRLRRFFELASVLVRFDQLASAIVNMDCNVSTGNHYFSLKPLNAALLLLAVLRT
jgi:hypothetical protein